MILPKIDHNILRRVFQSHEDVTFHLSMVKVMGNVVILGQGLKIAEKCS